MREGRGGMGGVAGQRRDGRRRWWRGRRVHRVDNAAELAVRVVVVQGVVRWGGGRVGVGGRGGRGVRVGVGRWGQGRLRVQGVVRWPVPSRVQSARARTCNKTSC